MKDLILLNAKTGANLRWSPPENYSFVRELPLLPVEAGEAGRLASALPLAMCKDTSQPSGWALVAVCGQADGQNTLVGANGGWLAKAAPACIAYLPFALKDIGAGKGLAGIDPRYARNVLALGADGVPLFDERGQLHAQAQKRVDLLADRQPRINRTRDILSALAQEDLFTPWPEAALTAGGIRLEGLHTIDEKKLSRLSDEAFLALRKGGALAVAYSCLLSLYQVRNLAAPATAASSGTATLEQADGDLDIEFLNDTDTIKFGSMH